MTIAWIDGSAGASGDMFLGALADAGVDLELMQEAVDALRTEPIRLSASTVKRHGLAGTKVDVAMPEAATDRRWRAIRGMIEDSALGDAVKALALDAFARLAAAEAASHGIDVEDVHFHEVGALDSIADIVGAAAGLAALGAEKVTASTVTVGGGTTRGSHGSIPLPAPAVLRVLADAGAPVVGAVPYEACTPTGAAIIAAAAGGFGPMPEMVPERIGIGAGGRDPKERANLLRIVIGSETRPAAAAGHTHGAERAHAAGHGPATAQSAEHGAATTHAAEDSAATASGDTDGPARPVVIETNVDDMDPRLWPPVLAALLEAGASDAWLSPILMKKGRPAHTLHVLCRPEAIGDVRSALVRHTTTIGMRAYEIEKYALEREYAHVEVDGHRIGVKLAREGGEVVNISIEYEDAAAAAVALARPLKVVMAEATAQAAARYR